MNPKSFLIKIYVQGLFISDRIKSYWAYHTRPERPRQCRVVIFAQGRTGSTLLESLLVSTGYFEKQGELLNESRGKPLFPEKYVLGKAIRTLTNFIFHVKIYQLSVLSPRTNPKKFLKRFHNQNWKIIYLRRENKVYHALSNIVAKARGDYHKYSKEPESIRVTIDTTELGALVKERIQHEKDEKEVLDGLNYLEVIYERDLEHEHQHQLTANKVLNFLEMEPCKVSTPHVKVNTTPLQELISNYDEFIEFIREQKWDHYIADQL